MTQRFWKFSAAAKKWRGKLLESTINKSLDSKFAAMGWYVEAKKDLSEFSDNKNVFKRQLSKIINSASAEILACFRFDLKENDILFLYGRDSFSIVAIGKVTKPYYFSLEKIKKPRFAYFVDVDWFCDMRRSPLDARKILENAGINWQPTLVQIKNPKVYNGIIELAKNKMPTVDFSNYIELLSEKRKLTDEPSEAEIRQAEDEIEQLSKEPFKLTDEQRFVKATKKARDAAFSRKIIEIYGGKCVVCGSRWQVDGSFETEAAHIVPKEENGTDNPRNGLALCRFHHWAFDRGLFTINESYYVIVSPHIHESSESFKTLQDFADKEIKVSDREESRPHKDALKWHLEHVFRK